MSNPITIRNLTAQPLTLKLVERYEVPGSEESPRSSAFSVSSLKSNFTNLIINSTNSSNNAPTSAQLSDKAESFAREEVDIRMEPFSTHPTEIATTQRKPNDILRLTFEGDGDAKWRIDTPTPSSASQVMTPLTPDPKHDYTVIYHPSSSFLAIFESTNLQSWMQNFHDSTPLSALSIPGTHNSPTCHKALPSVRCQAVSPVEQLNNGVRFFDIRVQVNKPEDLSDDSLSLVHGVFPISLTGPKKFRNLLDEIRGFLQANPSETVVLSLKREGTGNGTDQQLSVILRDHYVKSSPEGWFVEPRVPALGEARGKIVVMRRFVLDDSLKGEWDGKGWCLDAENWDYNTAHCEHGAVCVQDFCEVLETENIEKKITLCCEHFERAATVVSPVPGVNTDSINPVPPGPLYLNFLSASNFWKVGCWPDKIAEKLNPAVTRFLCETHKVGDKGKDAPNEAFEGDGGVGIVVCDWVGKDGDWDLVRCIVGMNSRLLLRERGTGWR